MNKSLMLIVGSSLLLCGCGSTTYTSKNNATQDQFMKDRYACYQETKTFGSFASVGPYGGGGGSSVRPTCDAFAACLAAKGYYETSAGETPVNGTVLTVPSGASISCR
jgi:hypothetical protein